MRGYRPSEFSGEAFAPSVGKPAQNDLCAQGCGRKRNRRSKSGSLRTVCAACLKRRQRADKKAREAKAS